MDAKLHGLAAGALTVICIFSFFSMLQVDKGSLTVENGTALTSDGISISYLVYVPNGDGPFTGILVGHGFSASKEIMDGYARALASSGFIVFSYDHRGHGSSGGALASEGEALLADIKAMLDVMRADLRAKDGSYGLVGYSMGGGAGYQLAEEDTDLVAMVGVAPALDEVAGRPDSLLVIVGALDELFSSASYRSVLSSRIGIEPIEIENGVTYGHDGMFTELWVSPYHDHLTISYSQAAHERCASWMANAFGMMPKEARTATRLFYALSGIVSGIIAIVCMVLLLPKSLNRLVPRPRTRASSLSDIVFSILYFPLTALLVAPTIVLGLPMTTGYTILLAMGALPSWRMLRKDHLGQLRLDSLKGLFSGDQKSYVSATAAGLGMYGVLAAFLGNRYLGIVPSTARLPAVIATFLILSLVFALDAWGHMGATSNGSTYGSLYRILRYAAARLLPIAVIVILASLASGNSFFVIALYAGVPLVVLYSILMWAIMDRTGSCGAAGVCCAIVVAPMLVAVSPLIGMF